jgi:D-alanine-D-alanine ligase
MNESGHNSASKDHRKRIGIIFGGRSGEHEVSLMSARSVMSALDPDKYEIVMIGISKTGRWLTGDVALALESGIHDATNQATLLPDPQSRVLVRIDDVDAYPATMSEVSQLDVIFPVLHGPYGEDGTVQGLLELAGLPYVGAGVVGSAVGMDKAIFKAVMIAHRIPILPWMLVLSSEWHRQPEELLQSIETKFSYPLFTKPANLGSSVGISKCNDSSELVEGLAVAARYDRRLIVEQGIDARELEVSVMGNDDPIASVVGEVKPRRDFYDYVAKYVSDDSELIIPAQISQTQSDQVRQLAVQAFKAMDCAGLGRADFLLDKRDGQLYINEINTIPGFTRISMYPKLWEASGIGYSQLLDHLIELALDRHQEKSMLDTSFKVENNA